MRASNKPQLPIYAEEAVSTTSPPPLPYDPQRFHVDPEAVAQSPFRRLIAGGWHEAALFMRLYVEGILGRNACLGSPAVSDIRLCAPVRPG